MRPKHNDKVIALAYSTDGKCLTTASSDYTARVFEIPTGVEKARTNFKGEVKTLSLDGKYLATISENHTARVWEVERELEVARMIHDQIVSAVAFSPYGKYLATTSEDNIIQVFEVTSNNKITNMKLEDLNAEACAQLTRNLTKNEWKKYMDDEPFRKTCPDLP
jgi:WD40 repeat protein